MDEAENWTPGETTAPATKAKRTRKPRRDRAPNDFPTDAPTPSTGIGDGAGDTAESRTRKPTFAEDVAAGYETIAAALAMAGFATGSARLVNTADAVANNADKCAKSLVKYAARRPKVKRAIKKILDGSDTSELVAAHVGLGLAIMAANGITVPGMIAAIKARTAPKAKPTPRPVFAPGDLAARQAEAIRQSQQANVNGMGFPIAPGVAPQS